MKIICIVVIVVVVLISGSLTAVSQWYMPKIRREARAEFQRNAIAEIARLTDNTKWIEQHLASMPEVISHDDRWFSQKLIVMKNRDWIVYQAECNKSDRKVGDIFIGRGSNGKWYYTNYHFCKQMKVLEVDDTPDGLPSFIEEYSCRDFNGSPTAELP